jgi:UDP-glucuronate decarboxylase
MVQNKRILITGGAGFIGTHLCQCLIDQNQITIFDNLTRNAIQYSQLLDHENLTFVEGDVRDQLQVNRVVKGQDIVLHLAAIAGVSCYYAQSLDVIQVNYNGTENVLNALKDNSVELFLDMSTSEIYGKLAHSVDEHDPPSAFPPDDMRSVYTKSKSLGEQLAFCYANKYNIPVLSIRPFNIYGPGQVGEGAISNMVQKALKGETLKVTNDGSAVRAWCYIDDFIEGILAAIDIRGTIKAEALNIGNPAEVQTTLNIARMILRISESNSKIEFVKHPGTDIQIRIPKIDKAKGLLNYQPKIDLETGIERTINWWRQILFPQEEVYVVEESADNRYQWNAWAGNRLKTPVKPF